MAQNRFLQHQHAWSGMNFPRGDSKLFESRILFLLSVVDQVEEIQGGLFFPQKLSVHCAGTRAKKRVRFGKAAVTDSRLREDLHSNNMMMLLQHIPPHECPLPSAGLEWEKADKQLHKRPKKTNCCSNCRLQNTIAFVSLCTSTRKETGGELSTWKMWLKDTIHHLILEYPEILWHVAAFLSLNRKRGMRKILCIHTVHETLSITALFVTQCYWFI